MRRKEYKAKKVLEIKKEIKGTTEELEEAFEIASEFTFNILNYADKEEPIPKEELDKARRVLAFLVQGPKASYFRLNANIKLTSAEVIYLLTTSLPTKVIAERLDINYDHAKEIRQGKVEEWYWEWCLVKRLKTIIRHNIMQNRHSRLIYSVSKLNTTTMMYEILMYTSSFRKAKVLRESVIGPPSLAKMIRENTLEIKYPIERIEVIV